MRRIITFILAIALLCTGIAGFVYLVLFAARWFGWMWMAAGLMTTTGAMWLYSDFIDATPNEQILKGELIPPSHEGGLPTRRERR